jgi:hypothetical protein
LKEGGGMADYEAVLKNLKDELKELRKNGYMDCIQTAFTLKRYMGCKQAATEHIASCFIRVVRHFIPDQASADLLLALTQLLEGFEGIGSTESRYKTFYDDFIKPNKTLKDPKSSLRKRSTELIDTLAKCIIRAGDLSELVAGAPETLTLPEAQQKTSAQSYDHLAEELIYYDKQLMNLPYKTKKRIIFFSKLLIDVLIGATVAYVTISDIVATRHLDIGQHVVLPILCVGLILLANYVIEKWLGMWLGYQKQKKPSWLAPMFSSISRFLHIGEKKLAVSLFVIYEALIAVPSSILLYKHWNGLSTFGKLLLPTLVLLVMVLGYYGLSEALRKIRKNAKSAEDKTDNNSDSQTEQTE